MESVLIVLALSHEIAFIKCNYISSLLVNEFVREINGMSALMLIKLDI